MSTIVPLAPADEAIFVPERGLSTRVHEMPFGASVQLDGSVLFRLWAPDVACINLAIDGREDLFPLFRQEDGWHELHTDEAKAGTRYRYVLPDGTRIPDPASRFQPHDVHGPSEVIAPGSYLWHDTEWCGRPWHETVLYELHVGAFTPEGTFREATKRLEHLRALGVTAIEVMPVADFPGRWNWGYDGAILYAPDSSYGRPEDFKGFVEAAHTCGISVILDVVYNHFGPDGNYIREYFKNLFTNCHKTDWGDAVNYDGPQSEHVREFILHNALYWVEEFHLDGLRLDAVHAILDDGPQHILDELAEALRNAVIDRPLHLILENENNEACRLPRDEHGNPTLFTAQWNDDMHHVLHTAGTHEDTGYYKDYKGETRLLGRALAEGFAYQGEIMVCSGKPRGEPCAYLPPTAFISFLQNHDQVGNRAFGERLRALVSLPVKRALAAIYLLLPQVPMLFMGEEWNSAQPFPYFCDFEGELADKVRDGKREEFSSFPEFADPEKRNQIPDPQSEETFRSAKLDWSKLASDEGTEWLERYRNLLRVRRESILPFLLRIHGCAGTYEIIGPGAVRVCWKIEGGQRLELLANLCEQPLEDPTEMTGTQLWVEGPAVQDGKLGAWTVRWSLH